ncbi:hypothetical protein RDV89_08560 [Nocardioides zeae]|uniref:DUF2178 domain-containing protein n=1 Tax=Nocardioides imazamoxiresistens TaxID=3231893 RepID=A0ABU3PV55_9ACTN|nr:hypothetical protein [Nocardioides zeae]MDT9593117.1 hypothetical protein [Nocardioides zeae]
MTAPTTRGPADRAPLAVAVVGAGALSWLTLATLSALGPWSWAATLATLVFCACWLGSRFLIGDIAEKRRGAVDEYELEQRDRARNVGYTATLLLGAVVFVVLTVAVNLADGGDDALLRTAPGLVFSALVAGAALPSYLLTWQLRHQRDD